MANLSAVLKVILSYTGPSAESLTLPTEVLAAPYLGQTEGAMVVPAAADSGDTFSIPFDSIAAATLVIIQNRTDVEMTVKINDAAASSHSLPPGGICIPVACASAPANVAVTAIDLAPVAEATLGGTISYRIFGDPGA